MCVLLLCAPAAVTPQEYHTGGASPQNGSRLYMEADSVTVEWGDRTVYATGNVDISRGDVCLEAEEVSVDLLRESSSAMGNVRLLKDGDILDCNEMEYHWADQTGWIKHGRLYFQETGYRIEGDILEKTGPDTYSLEQGSFTTCDCPRSSRLPWRISAGTAEVTLGGYAKIKDAKFYVYELPVLYFPIAYLPVKLRRESGFLLPRVGHSGSHGWEMGIPFYWAITASMDATVDLQGLTKRGFKPSLEFRYVPNRSTSGEVHLSGIYDEKTEEPRYGIKAIHQQQASSSFYNKFDIELVGDKDYIVDFPGEVAHPSERFVESKGIVGVRKDNLHATAQLSYFNLVAGRGATQVPQMLPHLHMDLLRTPLLSRWLSYGLGSSFVNFVSEEGSERTRLDLFPRLLLSFPLAGAAGMDVKIGFRETCDWEDWEERESQGIEHREVWEATVGTEVPMWRRFHWGSYRLLHIVRPRIQYQYVEPLSGDELPVFDGIDALSNRNILTYSLSNVLMGGKDEQERKGPARTFLEFTLTQNLDLRRVEDDEARQSLSDVCMFLTLSPVQYVSLQMDLGWDHLRRQIRSVHGGVRFADSDDRYRLQLGYVSVRSQVVDTVTRVEVLEDYDKNYFFPGVGKALRGIAAVRIFDWLRGSLKTYYLLDESGKIENRLEMEYLSRCRCWSVLLSVRQTVRPDDVGVGVRFQLEGLGSSF